jgi:hypothetical protein
MDQQFYYSSPFSSSTSGFNSLSGAVSENPLCFGSVTFSGCSEKSFSALSEKSVSKREVRTHNAGTNYRFRNDASRALVDEAIESLNLH